MNTRVLSCSLLLAADLTSALAQPAITLQPTDQSVSLGASVKFQVSATSTIPPIRYQWRFGARELAGQTNSTLNLTNIQGINAGDYDAVVTDGSGSVTSRVAQLEVDPTFTKITTGDIVTDFASHLSSAWGDYDGDGDIDLAVTGTWIQASGAGSRIRLFRNNGDGSFTRDLSTPISAEAKDWRAGPWIDYDNDGWLDLIATHTRHDSFDGGIMFFRNEGQGSFRKMTPRDVGPIVPSTPPHAEDNSQGVGWADYDRDGFLDVFVSRQGTDWLFRNLGDGSFAKMSSIQTGIAADQAHNYGIMWGDFDNDGWPDLFVPASDNGTHRLYRNLGGGRFSQVTNGSIAADRDANSGTWVDYDNDGHLDLFVVHGLRPDKTNALYRNNGDGTFTAMPGDIIGPVVTDVGMYAGSSCGDYDNDGHLDVIVTNNDRNPGGGPNFLYHNNGDGSFTRVLSGSPANDAGAASTFCTWADYDEDGFLDLFVARSVFVEFTNLLYRNNGNSNHWIKVKLTGTVSNRMAIGAKVRVKATIRGKTFWQMREISSGPAFSQTPLTAHFGLGDATKVETLRIEWPSGTVQEFHDVAVKQSLTITEPPRLQVLGRLADGSFQLSLTGGFGMSYNVESSTDLARWTKWTSLTITNRTTTITDSITAAAPQRFYRAVSR